MSDQTLMHFLHKFLITKYKQVFFHPDYFVYAPGSNGLCLISHVDTVPRGKLDIVLTKNGTMFNRQGVLGGDCRAGVFAILKLIELCVKDEVDLPSVVFTNHEETGGDGMRGLIQSRLFDPDQCHLLLALDRRGRNEFVYYSSRIPLEARRYIEGHGYKEAVGIFSDVALLSYATRICGINLSIGFRLEHSPKEFLRLPDLLSTIKRVFHMLKHPISRQTLTPKQLGQRRRNHADSKKSYKDKCLDELERC